MARITVEDCLQQVGNENRFALIHLAVSRVKQHRKGAEFKTRGKNKESVMTLREIAAGDVTFGNIRDFKAPAKEAEKPVKTEAATTAATEA